MLDLDKIGPNWDFAANHGLACCPGKPVPKNCSSTNTASIDSEISVKHTFCQCCLNIIHKNPISLCENSKELQFLGFGFPLYFIFIKYSIILLILQIVTYSALSISWALQTSFDICEEGAIRHLPGNIEGRCTSWLLKFMRTELDVTRDEVILRFTSFFIHLMGLIYMRDMIRKTNDYYDERTTSLNHYSILIKNLPNKIGADRKIRSFMKNGFKKEDDNEENSEGFKVEQLVILNELENFYRMKDEKNALIKEKQKWMREKESEERTRNLREIDEILRIKCQQIEKQHALQRDDIIKDVAKCEKAIIVMESEDAKNQLLQAFKKMDKEKLVEFFGEEGQKVEIDEAPQPREIIWENINFPSNKRMVRLVIGWGLTVLFIAAVTAIFYAILTAKVHAVEQALKKIEQAKHTTGDQAELDEKLAHTEEQKALIITISTMVLIIFFNKFCLSYVLYLFTNIEKHRTGSEYQFSFALKYTIGLFFTTSLMTLLVEDIAFHNIYKQSYGVVQEESIMFFFNAFLVPIILLINPWYIFKVFMRWLNQGRTDYTQKQANSLMENPRYSMGKMYAELIESIWFTYLYYSVIPGGTIIILFGIIFFYWVDKYNLLRKSSINENVNGELSMQAMKLMDATLMLRAAGEIIFDSQIRHEMTWQSVVCMIIGGIYLFLPMDDIIQFFHEEKFRTKEKPYSEVKSKFIENYHTMHPLYAQEKYALISGINLTTQMVSNHLLLTEETLIYERKELNEPSEIKEMRENEMNFTKIELVQVKAREESFMQFG